MLSEKDRIVAIVYLLFFFLSALVCKATVLQEILFARFGNASFGPSRSLVPFWSVLLEKDRIVAIVY